MDALKLRATLGLDRTDYEEGLTEAENSATQKGSVIGKILGGTAKAAAAGLVATTGAAAALVKTSVQGYAEYEQLVGGVETLFSKANVSAEDFAKTNGVSLKEAESELAHYGNQVDVVMENAANAYKTSGLSAAEYMDTVSTFSASLISSLGEYSYQAGNYADMAITDMSDNANKMGTSMESIQNAYAGFAKQNFTMLDNLKLGYGGTKEEMERLLRDAEKLEGLEIGSLDENNFADVVTAINIIQTEMGITGTTAKEAGETISGSLTMLGKSWQDLVTGMTNPDADISLLISNVVESAKTAAKNLIPAIGQALKGLSQIVKEIAPVISKELPGLVDSILPPLLDAAISLLEGLINALPNILQVLFSELPRIVQAIIDATLKLLPMIIELGLQLILSLAQGILDSLPELIPALVDTILKIVEILTDPGNLTLLIEAAVQIILALTEGLIQALPKLIEALPKIIKSIIKALIENLPLLIDATVQIIVAIAQALIENLPLLLAAAVQIIFALVDGIIEAIPYLLGVAGKLVTEFLAAIIEMFPTVVDNGIKLIGAFIEGIVNTLGSIIKAGATIVTEFIKSIRDRFVRLKEAGKNMIDTIKNGIKEKIDDAKNWGKDLIQNFIDGLKAKWEDLKKVCSDIAGSIKDFLGFSEPKLGPLSNFHTYAPDMMELFAKGVRDNKDMLDATIADAFNFQPVIEASASGSVGAMSSSNVWNININQPVHSATDVAKAVREEAQYGLIGGGSIGN